MMVHPAPFEDLLPRVERGRALRASSTPAASRTPRPRPQLGINAADAFTVAQVAIGLLRQHLRAGRSGARHRHARRRRRQHRARAHRRAAGWCAPRTIDELARAPAARRALLRGRRARDRRDARRSNDVAPVYSHMEHDHDLVDVYRANADDARPPDPDDERDDVLDRHGQRVARDAVDPSVHRDRERRRGEPPTRVRGRVHQRVGRPRGARRRARAGVDRDRRRDRPAARRGSSASRRVRRSPACRRRRRSRRLAAGRRRIRKRLDGCPFADGGRERGRFPVETRPAHHDVAGLLCPVQSAGWPWFV